jgi:hypothetical protein
MDRARSSADGVCRIPLFDARLALDRPPGVNRDMGERRVPFLIEGPSFAADLPEAAAIEDFRSEIFNADAVFLFDYWLSKCTGTGIPRKALIDPAEVPNLLPAIYIEEWDDERRQSRIRLAGEFHRELAGFSVQGLAVDDHATGRANEIWKQCDRCNFFELRPTLCGYTLEHVDKAHKCMADLTLPMRDESENVLTIGLTWCL